MIVLSDESLIFCLFVYFSSQVLVCAPSNIAVDQLTEKIHKTGLKVLLLHYMDSLFRLFLRKYNGFAFLLNMLSFPFKAEL